MFYSDCTPVIFQVAIGKVVEKSGNGLFHFTLYLKGFL